MEEWERRYLHEKAVIEIQCASIGLEAPANQGYGRLQRPRGLWRRFCGPEFWKRMDEAGHTSIDFDECRCKKGER